MMSTTCRVIAILELGINQIHLFFVAGEMLNTEF